MKLIFICKVAGKILSKSSVFECNKRQGQKGFCLFDFIQNVFYTSTFLGCRIKS